MILANAIKDEKGNFIVGKNDVILIMTKKYEINQR